MEGIHEVWGPPDFSMIPGSISTIPILSQTTVKKVNFLLRRCMPLLEFSFSPWTSSHNLGRHYCRKAQDIFIGKALQTQSTQIKSSYLCGSRPSDAHQRHYWWFCTWKYVPNPVSTWNTLPSCFTPLNPLPGSKLPAALSPHFLHCSGNISLTCLTYLPRT